MKINIERVELHENYPIDGESYAIMTDGNRFAFAWGPEYPYSDALPIENVLDGESGIEWHDTVDSAKSAMMNAMGAHSGN